MKTQVLNICSRNQCGGNEIIKSPLYKYMYIFLSFIHQNRINTGICLQLYMKFQYQWRFQIFAITCTCIEREKYCIHATD